MKILLPKGNAPGVHMERVLCVYKSVSFYPTLEHWILGRKIVEEQDEKAVKTLFGKPSRALLYRSNPRSADYMLDRLQEFVSSFAPKSEVDILAEVSDLQRMRHCGMSCVHKIWASKRSGLRSLEPELTRELISEQFDTIVLIYTDAIGLGWTWTERVLRKLNIPTVLIMNGRRRVFILDDASQRKLKRRRFVEKLWLAEIVLAPAIILGGIPLALWDAVVSFLTKQKSRQKR